MSEFRAPARALIFDMDGVLINSMPLHTEAWEVYLRRAGIRVEGLEARMHGKRNRELVRDFIGEGLAEEEVHAHGAAKERLFRELMAPRMGSYLIPGVRDFLERYREMPKAVASNAERANIDFVIDGLNLRGYFEALVDGSEVARPKPYPDIYLRAAKLMGVEPAECIVFEDSPAGAEAGLAADMRVVGVETIPAAFPEVDITVGDFLDAKLEPWMRAQTSGG